MGANAVIPASAGAKLNITVNGLSGIKNSAAMLALDSATVITYSGIRGSGMKLIAAFAAIFNRSNIGKPSAINKVRVVLPKLNISGRMTTGTKCDQVFNTVSFAVIIEKMKRCFMVNMQTLSFHAAMPASIVVPILRRLSLLIPILTPIVSIATKPCRIIFSRPIGRFTPSTKASTTTKVMLTNSRWLPFKNDTTSMACYSYSLFALSDIVNFLPFTVTGKAAKVFFGLVRHIWFSLVFLSALFANQCNGHVATSDNFITQLKWSVVNGSHFAI